MKRITVILALLCLLVVGITGCGTNTVLPTAEKIPEIEDAYDQYLSSYKEQLGFADQRIKDNLQTLKALNYKAYAYCSENYYVQSDVMNGDDPLTIKTFVQDGNVRREEYHGDTIAYVQVYNAGEDIYYEYDAAKDNIKKITNASQKGWNLAGYDYGYFPWKECNAVQGERSETELNNRKAELYDYDMGVNGYNGIWYDAEYGVPLQYTQGKWTEVYTVVPKTNFDTSVFTFDSAAPCVPITIEDIHSVQESETAGSSDSEEQANTGKLSLETLEKIPKFASVDMNGNEITNEVFSEYKLTLVNLWGTWCSPCVAEMPNLQKLYEKYGNQGLNIIGVTEDATGNEDLVQQIVETQGVTYTILYPDAQFYDDFVALCFTDPSSLLVDSEGNVLQIFTGDPGFDALDSAVGNSIQ